MNQFPVYLNKESIQDTMPYYSYIDHHSSMNIKDIKMDTEGDNIFPQNTLYFKLNIFVPRSEIMQHFIQWQRYRKYWWSSVTTTPSLISINDMKHEGNRSNVNIIANFSDQHVVETISIDSDDDKLNKNNMKGKLWLTCSMGLESALLTILLDGLSNTTKEEYIKLHNKMAPYKMSFALDSEGMAKDPNVLNTLRELSTLLFYKLKNKKIKAWLPSFTLPLHSQVKENLHLGVTYTAILSEMTLTNGIFNLLNSSTMLKEQIHVADFDSYAALLCGK